MQTASLTLIYKGQTFSLRKNIAGALVRVKDRKAQRFATYYETNNQTAVSLARSLYCDGAIVKGGSLIGFCEAI